MRWSTLLLLAVLTLPVAADEPKDWNAIFEANTRGLDLYGKKRYDDALPHLQVAAENGFDQAQARLGGLYLYGLGVDRSDLKGLAWLGTAAHESEDPNILELFATVWEKVPENAAPQVQAIIDQYVERYGVDPSDQCRKSRQAGSHIAKATCIFDDKYHTLQEFERESATQATIGTNRSGIEPPL